MSKALFILASLIAIWGVAINLKDAGAIGGTGTMAMNTYYLLAIVLFVAAAAAKLVWEEK